MACLVDVAEPFFVVPRSCPAACGCKLTEGHTYVTDCSNAGLDRLPTNISDTTTVLLVFPCVQYEGWAPRGRACMRNVCVCSHVCVARSFVRLSVTRHRAGYLSLQSEFRPGFVFESSRRERRTIAPTRKGDPPVRVLLLLLILRFFFYSSILVR